MTDAQSFGAWLRRARNERGLNQSELASLVGVHYAYVSKLEGGRETPSVSMVRALAGVLERDQDEAFAALRKVPPEIEAAVTAEGPEAIADLRKRYLLQEEEEGGEQ